MKQINDKEKQGGGAWTPRVDTKTGGIVIAVVVVVVLLAWIL